MSLKADSQAQRRGAHPHMIILGDDVSGPLPSSPLTNLQLGSPAMLVILLIKGTHPGPGHWVVPGQVLTGKRPQGAGNLLQTSRYQGVGPRCSITLLHHGVERAHTPRHVTCLRRV